MINLKEIYKIEKKEFPQEKGCWSKMLVEIFIIDNGGFLKKKKIGEYERNYSSFFNTFVPFEKNGKHYAMYSKDYQTTSVMSLPDCKHIADTESGFCPMDFFVPDFKDFFEYGKLYRKSLDKAIGENNKVDADRYSKNIAAWDKRSKLIGTRALVSGCIWGDDSGGEKVNMIDISEIEKGKISILNELGYFQLPALKYSLEDLVVWDDPERLSLPLNMDFDICKDDNSKSGFLGYSIADIKMYSGDWHDNFEVKETKTGKISINLISHE